MMFNNLNNLCIFQWFFMLFVFIIPEKSEGFEGFEDQGPHFFPKSKLLAKVMVLTSVDGLNGLNGLACWMVHMTLLY